MRVITNEAFIERNARIARYAGVGGLLVLAVGAYISFTAPENIIWAWVALIAGFALAQIGVYFGNRWGRRPRMYELITRELKGFDQNYALYHYYTPASHLLVGPCGIWVIFPFYQRGIITYENGRWRQRGGGLFLAYMRLFAQEGLGRIEWQIQGELDALKRFLKEKVDEELLDEVQAVLVFTNEQAVVDADDAPYPTIPLKKLKETIKKAVKSTPLSLPKAKAVQDAIELSITRK